MIRRNLYATRIFVAVFGALVAVAGIEHGIGEVLQGNVAPDGPMILSWPESPLFSMLSGEPAFTIIPNLLLAGVLTILFSFLFLVWAILYVQNRHGGVFLILLSIIMFLVGGGIFPPVFGIIIGIVGTRVDGPFTWWRDHLPSGLNKLLGTLWPWSLAAGLAAWLSMFPGIVLLVYFFRMGDNPELVLVILVGMLGFFFSTIVTGFAFDSLRQKDALTKFAPLQTAS